ncbi:hypothetical protein DB347_25165 [Opitutaceae bacterium EW11]|nr:hypothetical protein DB347_25165 [Opitutaceae bacterium EW11]
MPFELPTEYWDFLESDAAVSEGGCAGFPGYFVLWHPDEVEEQNRILNVAELAPGFLGFGGDGGGEMLAFNAAGAIYALPLVGMAPRHARKVANSWSEFQQRIQR